MTPGPEVVFWFKCFVHSERFRLRGIGFEVKDATLLLLLLLCLSVFSALLHFKTCRICAAAPPRH